MAWTSRTEGAWPTIPPLSSSGMWYIHLPLFAESEQIGQCLQRDYQIVMSVLDNEHVAKYNTTQAWNDQYKHDFRKLV
jgi:hypothetical protein